MKRYLNGISFQHYDSMSREIEKNKQEIEKYKARDLDMSTAVDDSKKEAEELKACLGSKDASINTLKKEIEKLKEKSEQRERHTERLQGKFDTQKEEIITLKNEGIEMSTEMTTLRNEKNKLEEQVKRKDLEIKALLRRMVSDERKHDANQAHQQRHNTLAQSVSKEQDEDDNMNEDDKKLQDTLSKTIVDKNKLNVGWDDVAGLSEAKTELQKVRNNVSR